MKANKRYNTIDISGMVNEDGQLSDSQLDSLGLVDVTYSEPEFVWDCGVNYGRTLGYYQATDKSIWRSSLINEDCVELNRLPDAERRRLRKAYKNSGV
jgi:hypothetical protein